MDAFMKENFSEGNLMGKENLDGLMENISRDNGQKIRNMEREFIIMQMVEYMKEILLMIYHMVLVN